MEVTDPTPFRIADPTAVGEARRSAAQLARSLGLSESDAGRLAIVVTEAATNLVKHAGGGELFLQSLQGEGGAGVGVIALDRGPGIANLAEALRDGYSTGGTPGTGLGAIARVASHFDVYSNGGGAALLAQIWPEHAAPRDKDCIAIGGINVPYPGETVSGDAWAVQYNVEGPLLLVADGLGHGPQAHEAARVAVETFERCRGGDPAALLGEIHLALRPTRGAAVAMARIDRSRGAVRFAGIGNISATIASDAHTRSLVSHHGTAGNVARRLTEFSYPWKTGDVLVVHSDGLGSHWTLEDYPGLAQRTPALIAAVLYRDHRRGRDDITVVVVRETA